MSRIFRSRRKKKERKQLRESYRRDVEEVRRNLGAHLQEDGRMQAHIKYLYNELYVYILVKLSEKSVIRQLDNYAPDFISSLRDTIEKFDEIECPIVVAGETSAGKSSILNLILGEPILPVSLVRATSTVCHIANGEHKTVTVVHDDGRTESFDIKKNKQSAKEAIEKHVLRQSGTSRKEVFIKWPVPFLQGRLTIVDTPGISEPDMAEKVRAILPRAAAFVYVVNTMNAGGVLLDGKLFELLKTQSRETSEIEHLPAFDPRSAIFVLNKWDCVPPEEERDVEEVVHDNLQMCWPGLDKDQLIKLSAKEEQGGMTKVSKFTDRFKKLCYGIENLIPIGLKINTKSQYKRLWNLSKYLERIVNVRLENARKTQEEKAKEVERLNRRSSLLIEDIKRIMADVREILERKSNDIASTMCEYFRYPDVIAKITKWDKADAPRGKNLNDIHKDINLKVRKRIHSELENFVGKSEFYTATLEEIYQVLEEKFQLVDKELKKWESDMSSIPRDVEQDSLVSLVNVGEGENSWYMRALESVLGSAIQSDIPLLTPTNYIMTLVSMAVMAALEMKQKIELNSYNKDRTGFMAQRTRDALKRLDKDSIRVNVVDKVMENIWLTVSVIERNIPRLIEADKTLINDALIDLRDMDAIIRGYLEPKRFCRSFKAKLILFRIQHFSDCSISESDVECGKRVGSGAYSNVYEAKYGSEMVAIKDFHNNGRDTNEIYYQCLEVDALMTLKHENVVELYGVIFDDSQPNRQPKLKLVMELCDNCLWDLIRDDPDRSLVPAKLSKSSKDEGRALKFYHKTLRQIVEGLAFIHSKGYVHRDLKLSNILVKNDIVKISDVGLSAVEDDITGTACGTVSHMAPEVLERRFYGQPADIYSLGILMWELWYGDYSYENYTRFELVKDVLGGHRPTFTVHERPNSAIRNLMQACWQEVPEKRPTAESCQQQLSSMTQSSWSFMTFLGIKSHETKNVSV